MTLDRHHLSAARLWAATSFPYLASALFAMTVVERPGLAEAEGSDGVAVDDRWRLYLDPTTAAAWSVGELGALLVHHAGHLVRDHAGRAESVGVTDTSAERWAFAADAELNDDLADAGLVMPGNPVVPEDFGYERGRLAEEYFHRLGDDEQAPAKSCDHGSGSHGRPRPWEDEGGGQGDDPQSQPQPGLEHHEQDLVRAAVANDILAGLKQGIGNVPSNWRRWAEDLLAPTVDWRRVLAAEIRRGVQNAAGCVDYSYRRPSRRAPTSPDVVLPSLYKPVPEVAIVCDTSGSMGAAELGRVLAEVEGILAGIGLRSSGVRVLAVDAAVQTVRRVATARQVDLVGGGGTDMGAGIDAAAALKPRPAVVVVLTDGLTPWPSAPPRGLRVVVGLLASPLRRMASVSDALAVPSWARVVHIDDDVAAA